MFHSRYFCKLTYVIFRPCSCCAHCSPSCVHNVTMQHSLAKTQGSGMHVALDRLPAPGLAAPRHHAPSAVAATWPPVSTGASPTPTVNGPRWGSSSALPTLIHSPTGKNDVGPRTNRHGWTWRKDQERIDDRQTHKRTKPESKKFSVKLVKLVKTYFMWLKWHVLVPCKKVGKSSFIFNVLDMRTLIHLQLSYQILKLGKYNQRQLLICSI